MEYGWTLSYVRFILQQYTVYSSLFVIALDHNNAMRELAKFDYSAWKMLGGNLQVPFPKLNEFSTVITRPSGQYDALAYMINYWLKNDLHASWEKLASAVEKCGDAVRANTIRENVGIAPAAGT